MARLYSNNYSTALNGAITDTDLTITVDSVVDLPAIGGGDTCKLTITDGTNIEIVNCTAVAGSVITITRAEEGTTAVAFADGSLVELRATAESYPSSTGGASPAFSARGDTQSVPTGISTKIDMINEDFDTGDYDHVTSTFTPLEAGNYLITSNVTLTSVPADTVLRIMIYKNGALYRNKQKMSGSASENCGLDITEIMELNGTTDYVQIFVLQGTGAGLNVYNTNNSTWFSGSKIG